MKRILRSLLTVGLLLKSFGAAASDHTLLTPWGNVTGTRVDDEWVEFEAGVRIVHPGWTGFSGAVKYLQRPHYARNGSKRVVDSEIEGLAFQVALEETDAGKARLDLNVSGRTNLAAAGVFFFLDLPDSEFGDGRLEFIDDGPGYRLPLPPRVQRSEKVLRQQPARGLRITAPRRTLELEWGSLRTVRVRRDLSSRPTSLNDPAVRQQFVTGLGAEATSYQVYLELVPGDVTPTCSASASIQLAVTAVKDPQPVHLVLDAAKPGRPFQGIGGNFRLQFPKTDPAVLQHNLEQLRLAWGRFDLYWAEWDPEEQQDPLATARAGNLPPKIVSALDTARTLAQQQIRLIVSAWVPPKWARAPGPQPAGLRGTALDTNKLDRICSSLTSYLVYLKEHAGIEAAYFSFNEPETGVEVRQTSAEHIQFIKAMGPHLARAGLTTKLLLGDTAHGTPAALDFIRPALADPTTHPFIGAVAFHSWRGCTAGVLPRWAEAACQLGVPLLVTETGPDAHLHEYPSVRLEPWFQLQEIELYLRICARAQPVTIMEWQLTTDYSVLSGGGVYGEAGPLKPTQRFWNLKQLGATPPGAFALPLTADRREITAAGFGDLLNDQYALHLVNRGAERLAVLSGLPVSVSTLRRLTTDETRGMEEGDDISVRNGRAEFTLPPASYTSLFYPASAAPSAQTRPQDRTYRRETSQSRQGRSEPRYPNCTRIFNGVNFDGWEADPSTWSVVDGAMRGVGGTSRLAYTKVDYGSFRLIFTARMNPVNGDHLGVLFWGDRPTDASKPKIDNAGWIQFMPPFAGMWDYHPPKHHNLPHEKIAQGSNDSIRWCTTEILCDLEKGTMRAAVDGVELARYTHPTPTERTDPEKRIVPGPIGLFRHGGGASEYKDVYVETNPKDADLITVKTPAAGPPAPAR